MTQGLERYVVPHRTLRSDGSLAFEGRVASPAWLPWALIVTFVIAERLEAFFKGPARVVAHVFMAVAAGFWLASIVWLVFPRRRVATFEVASQCLTVRERGGLRFSKAWSVPFKSIDGVRMVASHRQEPRQPQALIATVEGTDLYIATVPDEFPHREIDEEIRVLMRRRR